MRDFAKKTLAAIVAGKNVVGLAIQLAKQQLSRSGGHGGHPLLQGAGSPPSTQDLAHAASETLARPWSVRPAAQH
jgi:hypothetical protein